MKIWTHLRKYRRTEIVDGFQLCFEDDRERVQRERQLELPGHGRDPANGHLYRRPKWVQTQVKPKIIRD